MFKNGSVNSGYDYICMKKFMYFLALLVFMIIFFSSFLMIPYTFKLQKLYVFSSHPAFELGL